MVMTPLSFILVLVAVATSLIILRTLYRMAKKPDIVTVSSGYYSTEVMNANFTELRDAFDNTLSLDGSTPNAMNADLDLNNNDLLNVGTLNVQDFSVDGGSIDGYLTEAEAARDEAEASATAAASSETNAATSETNAANTQTTIEGLLASVNTTFGDDLIEYNGDVDDNTLAGGTYRVTGTATGDKYESAYNMLVLHRSNDDQIVQVAFLGTGIAVRGYSNPTWSDWEELATKTYVDTDKTTRAVSYDALTVDGTDASSDDDRKILFTNTSLEAGTYLIEVTGVVEATGSTLVDHGYVEVVPQVFSTGTTSVPGLSVFEDVAELYPHTLGQQFTVKTSKVHTLSSDTDVDLTVDLYTTASTSNGEFTMSSYILSYTKITNPTVVA